MFCNASAFISLEINAQNSSCVTWRVNEKMIFSVLKPRSFRDHPKLRCILLIATRVSYVECCVLRVSIWRPTVPTKVCRGFPPFLHIIQKRIKVGQDRFLPQSPLFIFHNHRVFNRRVDYANRTNCLVAEPEVSTPAVPKHWTRI